MQESKQREPEIAAALVRGTRRSLIENGTWERLEPALIARVEGVDAWLREAERAEWITLEPYLALMDMLRERLGDKTLASYGAARLRADVETGPLGPMLRSWMREFRRDPDALLRVAPHAWQAVTRNAGRMVIRDATPGRLSFEIEGPPPSLLQLCGWHRFLEGFGTELVRIAAGQGSFSISPDGASLSLVATWSV
jgi:hypothetical protein